MATVTAQDPFVLIPEMTNIVICDNQADHRPRRALEGRRRDMATVQHQTHGRANHGVVLKWPCPVGDRYHKEES